MNSRQVPDVHIEPCQLAHCFFQGRRTLLLCYVSFQNNIVIIHMGVASPNCPWWGVGGRLGKFPGGALARSALEVSWKILESLYWICAIWWIRLRHLGKMRAVINVLTVFIPLSFLFFLSFPHFSLFVFSFFFPFPFPSSSFSFFFFLFFPFSFSLLPKFFGPLSALFPVPSPFFPFQFVLPSQFLVLGSSLPPAPIGYAPHSAFCNNHKGYLQCKIWNTFTMIFVEILLKKAFCIFERITAD